MTWYCEGDADRIRVLLAHLPLIGKKRVCSVTQWTVEAGELDGLHGYADEPLRPVPVELWDGDKSSPIVDAAWRPPLLGCDWAHRLFCELRAHHDDA